tara:strand:+ start:79 stop:570 length:492 start_codon:yes stop_codon:yes gene_type:complete
MSQENLDVIRGLAQVAGHSYDGASDDKGEPFKIGLKREDGNPILDSRTVDGFKIRFAGPVMIVSYQSDIKLKDVYGTNFENEMEGTFRRIVSHLKKEYKKLTGNAVGLKALGECDILVQETSRIRVFVTAHKKYKIEGIGKTVEPLKIYENTLDKNFRNFLKS